VAPGRPGGTRGTRGNGTKAWRPDATAGRQGATAGRQGATAGRQGATAGRQGATAGRQGAKNSLLMVVKESKLQETIEGLKAGKFPSVRRAAKFFDVPETTLRNRYKGRRKTRVESHEEQQHLDKD